MVRRRASVGWAVRTSSICRRARKAAIWGGRIPLGLGKGTGFLDGTGPRAGVLFRGFRGKGTRGGVYLGGTVPTPALRRVWGGDPGTAEAIRVTFDPDLISYADLLDIFFATHDPPQLNRQGNDVGTQYRSAIFPDGPEQEAEARAAILRNQPDWPLPIVTTIEPMATWLPAEDLSLIHISEPTRPY